ncbi:hypothetical protein Pla110_23830 [Polystyrenella longa]|uniref:Uncharacterized protein n=1 Tax=Polystyrenella longa TaxID=2528007 RepID=A0A518CN47_9PLAN|nr:hypothetical protein [Polystyrenella longa]QDU80651.1 hypothetical protein Pla110_23830 [Polystyrenella longa]
MRYSKLILLILGVSVCFGQTGCYYLRVERDKKIACLRRSPVSVRKKTCSPSIIPQYKQPAGFSQTYKDYLYENDLYRQSWEPDAVQIGMNQAMRVEQESALQSHSNPDLHEVPVPEPLDQHAPELN